VTPRKWDVAWAGLDPARGREQAGRRPVLVLCNDRISALISLATVLPITTRKKGRRVYPSEVMLPAGYAGLPAESLILCHQIRTVAAERMAPSMGRVEEPGLRQAVDKALRLWLDLE
jgi:mRNA interferase MazF